MIDQKAYAFLATFRWLMFVFYLGLGLALVGFAGFFGFKVLAFMVELKGFEPVDAVLRLLGLIDATLVASLVVMVMLSGFKTFISRTEGDAGSATGGYGFSELKLKFMTTLTVIGAVNILESALETGTLNQTNILLECAVELVLVTAVLVFAYVEHAQSGHE